MTNNALDSRVVLVTGGGRGIGRSHCLELAAEGARVVVNDLGVTVHGAATEESPASSVAAEIVAMGGDALSDTTSVTDWSGVRELLAKILDRFGRLDAVVNNAGIVRDHMITSMSEEDWDRVIEVHLKGTFTVTKHACDHWRAVAKRGDRVTGRIVNTTSGAGLLGSIGQSAYGAAKAAIAGLTIVTAMEMERYGVTCNAVSPIAATRMTATAPGGPHPSDGEEGGWDPLDPGNSSPVVAWLASDDAGWLTGQVLRVEANTVWRMRSWSVDPAFYRSRGGERLAFGEIGDGVRRLYGVKAQGVEAAPRAEV